MDLDDVLTGNPSKFEKRHGILVAPAVVRSSAGEIETSRLAQNYRRCCPIDPVQEVDEGRRAEEGQEKEREQEGKRVRVRE